MKSEDHFNSLHPESLAASLQQIAILQAKEFVSGSQPESWDEGKHGAAGRESALTYFFVFVFLIITAELIIQLILQF